MKAVVAAFNQEKALVGAFSVIVQPVVEPMDRFAALVTIATARDKKVATKFCGTQYLVCFLVPASTCQKPLLAIVQKAFTNLVSKDHKTAIQ